MNKDLYKVPFVNFSQLHNLPIVDKLLIDLYISNSCTYVCTNSSRHASHQNSAPGRLFFYTLAD